MNLFIDKLLLFASSMIIYLTISHFSADVIPVIITVIFTCLLSYFDKLKKRLILTAGFVLCSLFLPALCLFLPLLCYDLLFTRAQWIGLFACASLVRFMQQSNAPINAALAVLVIFLFVLKYRTAAFERIKINFYDLRDTTKELARQLKQQNQELIKNQDDQVTLATLDERNRIAREIHDNVGHLLSRALLQIGAMLTISRDQKTNESLNTLKETLTQAMNSIRISVHDLHDHSFNMHLQLNELVKAFTFCPITFDYSIQHPPNSKVSYAFVSIVKEALANIVRHSNASQASITFREHPAFFQLIVSDNGHVHNYNPDNGIGLKNINDRVEAFHGLLHIGIDKGFELFITIPKENKIL
ncbi:sensor histidine kinase [Sporolactobacillus kofuensis]|uniref:histidine kinase n=1 Tax=Sporolactobacillus kofuensis TaxID=269672 RepID=A0ABW1WIX9_9BACL|nr:histidine kinase [Sporolactobacillus kofuensis]MCO7177124.1 histidine kinase [Sporolactobacillus kofuensis]